MKYSYTTKPVSPQEAPEVPLQEVPQAARPRPAHPEALPEVAALPRPAHPEALREAVASRVTPRTRDALVFLVSGTRAASFARHLHRVEAAPPETMSAQ